MEQSLEIQAREIQDLPLAEKQEKALEAIGEFASLARRTVEQAWVAGKWLAAVKADLPHGEFRRWLEEHGISKSTAHRFMQVAKIETSQLGTFDSMTAALKSLTWQKQAEKHHAVCEELARGRARRAWRAGQALTKIVERTSERELQGFLKENNIGRSEATAYRDLYERHSLEGLAALPVEELEALVL